MKFLKLSFLTALAAMLVMGLTGSAFAFHDGGVAKCEGCHTMHNSLKGAKMSVTGTALTGNNFLLIGSDPSSTCLSCHGKGTGANQSYHVATDATGYNGTTLPAQQTPGGDFSWLKVAFSTISTSAGKGMGASFGAPADMTKNRHGHHIVAADYGFAASTDYASTGNFGPGGSYPAGKLSCIGCHNPHNGTTQDGSSLPISISGSYGNTPDAGTAAGVYRFLGGNGYIDPNASYTFGSTGNSTGSAAPIAVAPATYNASGSGGISTIRVAYGSGMSEWCGNCHAGILNNSLNASVTHRHVAGAAAILNQTLSDGINPATTYQGYMNSGQTSGGSGVYWTLVPYEEGTGKTIANLLADSATADASSATGGNVMCLSCHRAHASGFDSMARFDIGNSFVTDPTGVYAFSGADHEMHPDTTGYYSKAYYDIPATVFGASQRSLCNKCHAKD